MTVMYTYFMIHRKTNDPELGEYHTFGIAVYRQLWREPVTVLRDVALDGDLVFRMVQTFNKHHLSPLHLKDAVLDMLE